MRRYIPIIALAACSGEGSDMPPPIILPPPPPPIAEPAPEPCEFAFAGFGQSNALGTNQDTTGNYNENERVTIYDPMRNVFVPARLGQFPYWPVNAFGAPFPAPNNILHNFGVRVAEDTGCDVKLILIATIDQPISTWAAGAEMDVRTIDEMRASGLELDAIVWSQGESDNDAPDGYADAFAQTLTRWREEAWFADHTEVFITEMPDAFNGAEAEQIAAADADPNVRFVRAPGEMTDGATQVHWSGLSYQRIGSIHVYNAWLSE